MVLLNQPTFEIMNSSDLLTNLRECRYIASKNKIDIQILDQKIEDITKSLQNCTSPNVSGNLEGLLELLFVRADMDWIIWNNDEGKSNRESALMKLLATCNPCATLVILLSVINQVNVGSRQELCLMCLARYFRDGRFTSLLVAKSTMCSENSISENRMMESLVNSLNSLPNTVANNTSGKFSEIFHHIVFFQMLALNTGKAIDALVAKMRKNESVSLKFISRMIGSFCSGSKADAFFGIFFPLMIANSHSDYIWRRLSKKIVITMDGKHLESLVLHFAKTSPWYGCMTWIFGDSIVHNRKLKSILTHKLLFARYFTDINVLKNVIGYIASVAKDIFFEVLEKLFSVWSDESALKHTSYDQHKYISQAILICLGHVDEHLDAAHKNDLNNWLAVGMSHHLNSTNLRTRVLGMIVGECVAKKASSSDNRLDFGYDKNKETESLLSLMETDEPPSEAYYSRLLEHHHKAELDMEAKIAPASSELGGAVEALSTSKSTFLKVISSCELESDFADKCDVKPKEASDTDSDDEDLEPYDMSNCAQYKKLKPPSYIRDCMEGLLESEDREKLEVSLNAVTDLIKKNPVAAKEVSLELCKILLFLANKFDIDNFTVCRMSAMKELVLVNPEEVASYLTHEFYEEEYCLQHRIDMLDALTGAAVVMSSAHKVYREVNTRSQQTDPESSHTALNWREVVDRRIEEKTRRFGKPKRIQPPPKANKFGVVAGSFFYPLLAGYDRRVRTMDLLGKDAIILGKLVHSLGVIVYASRNTVASRKMAMSLMEFVFALRFHSESYVRQSILLCVSMAAITVGETIEYDNLGELMHWIDSIISNDSNETTRGLAFDAISAVKNTFFKSVRVEAT